MASSIRDLVGHIPGFEMETKELVISKIGDAGITQAIRLAMIDLTDLEEVFEGSVDATRLAIEAWSVAKTQVEGWTKIPSVRQAQAAYQGGKRHQSDNGLDRGWVHPQIAVPKSTSQSAKRCSLAVSSFARRTLLGRTSKRHPKVSMARGSLEEIEHDKMKEAVERTHEVFAREAAETPRFQFLLSSPQLVTQMQMDVYRMGSKSYKVVARNATLAEAFFADMKVCKWKVTELNAFMVAAWVRGRVSGGQKTAARVAKQTLQLVSAATGVILHIDDPMVKGQLRIGVHTSSHLEPPLKAKDMDIDYVIRFEELVWKAITPQQRCFAGFFALLGGSSLRAADALRTRKLAIIGEALSGVSRMKTKKHWTKWFAHKTGFSGREWATQWLAELAENALPGPDFVIKAPNFSGDARLERPADYGDVRRMLHMMLMFYMDVKAEDAVTYNPHGFRHVLVTAGQQLKAYGIVSEEDLDRLGHWSKGSAMPRNYDAEAGVSEMGVRTALLQQIRQGWRPAGEGSLPARPVSNEKVYHKVGHKRRKKIHAVTSGGITECGWWACGDHNNPSPHAIFEDIPAEWIECRHCRKHWELH